MHPSLFLFLCMSLFLSFNPTLTIASASKLEKDIPLTNVRSKSAMAMVEEGLAYYNGHKRLNDGKPHDYPKMAADLFEKALGMEEDKTLRELVSVPLGDIYYFGKGRKQSYEKALEYYPQDLEVLDKDPALETRVGLTIFHVETARTGKRPLKNALIDRAIENGYLPAIENMVAVYLKDQVYVHIDYFWPYISTGSYNRDPVMLERAMRAVANTLRPSLVRRDLDRETRKPNPLPAYKGEYWGGYFQGMHTGNLLNLTPPLKEIVYHEIFAISFNILTELNGRLIEWHELVQKIDHKSFLITAVSLHKQNCERLRPGSYKQLSCLSCTHCVKSTHALTFGAENNLHLCAYLKSDWMPEMPQKLMEGISASRYLLNELERLHTVVLQDAVQQSRQQTTPINLLCDIPQLIKVKTALEQYALYLNTIKEYHAFLFTQDGQEQRNHAFRKRYGHLLNLPTQ